MQQPILSAGYYLRIEEQPAAEVRFRYVKEQRTSSERTLTTNESNKIIPVLSTNYRGRVTIIVVLVDKNKRPHPHSLVGTKCENGICIFETDVTDERSWIVFRQNVGIQCAKKPDVATAMRARLMLPHGDPFRLGHDPDANECIDLHEVRLAVIALMRDASRGCWLELDPVVTDVVRDSKASLKLNIVYTSDCSGPADGSELILLTDTIYNPTTVKVVFFGNGWQASAEIIRIHKSVAFVIRVPPYRDLAITENVHVEFVLTRKPECHERGDRSYDPSADQTRSNCVMYQYYPGPQGRAEVLRRANVAQSTQNRVPAPNLEDSAFIDSIYDELKHLPIVAELLDETLQNQEPPSMTPLPPAGLSTSIGQKSSFISQHLPNGPCNSENSVFPGVLSSATRCLSREQSSSIIQHLSNGPYNSENPLFPGASSSTTRCLSREQSSSISQHFTNGPYYSENSLFPGASSSTTRCLSREQSSSISQHFSNGPNNSKNSLFPGASSSTTRCLSREQSSSISQHLSNKPYNSGNSLFPGASSSTTRCLSREQSSSIDQHLSNGPYNSENSLFPGASSSTTRCLSREQSSSISQHLSNKPYNSGNSLFPGASSSTTRCLSREQSSSIDQHLSNGPYNSENSLFPGASSSTTRCLSREQSSSISQHLSNGPHNSENSVFPGASSSATRLLSMEQPTYMFWEKQLTSTLSGQSTKQICMKQSTSVGQLNPMRLSVSSIAQPSPGEKECSMASSPSINAAPPTLVGHRERLPAMEHDRTRRLQHGFQESPEPSREPTSDMCLSSDSITMALSEEFSKLSSSSSSDNSKELNKKMKYY